MKEDGESNSGQKVKMENKVKKDGFTAPSIFDILDDHILLTFTVLFINFLL